MAKTSARRWDTNTTRGAVVAVGPQSIEKAVRLVARQCGGRLVEDEDAGLLVESPGDDHELLAGEVERPDAGLGADVDAELVEHRPAPSDASPGCRQSPSASVRC